MVDAQTRDFFEQAHHEVAAAFECLAHCLDALLRAGVGGLGCLLGD